MAATIIRGPLMMRLRGAGLILLLVVAERAYAQTGSAPTLPVVVTHDNLRPAGRVQGGVLLLSIWAGEGRWYPQGPDGRVRTAAAFGEDGGPLSIPSPLVRVAAGTQVRATVRNTLHDPLYLHGLCDRPACAPIAIPAEATREVQFALSAPGTFHYWASTKDSDIDDRDPKDSQMGGAIVVDPPGPRVRDRVFVLGMFTEGTSANAPDVAVINGRPWPGTERLEYASGEAVRWRVLNLSDTTHPMHLHGFYFSILSAGDGLRDTAIAADERRQAVTERFPPGATRMLEWAPDRPGNWLFHCHMLFHHVADPHAHMEPASAMTLPDESNLGMQGFVLGIHVSGPAPSTPDVRIDRRELRLTVSPDTRFAAAPSYKVDLREGDASAPRLGSGAVPGPVMVLTRGQPVSIEVINQLSEPTAIHWHGIELESAYDGVPDFSGAPGSVTPPIAPGARFSVLFTPPRAGTFMYHTHWHNRGQLSGGIYGPIIVLEPGDRYDPKRDHIVMVGLNGPDAGFGDEPFAINGERKPVPLEIQAGVPNRLRFIDITADNPSLVVQLLDGLDPRQWTLVSKDGADIAAPARRLIAARQSIGTGEIYDFELAPLTKDPESLWLELRRSSGELVFQWPVVVK
jgi:manganese oxidase